MLDDPYRDNVTNLDEKQCTARLARSAKASHPKRNRFPDVRSAALHVVTSGVRVSFGARLCVRSSLPFL